MRLRIFSLLLFLSIATNANATPPNIVVVLTDDQEDTGSMSYLPNVRALAEQGVTFKNSFANFSLCAPSRSSLLTGEAAHNHGIKANQANKGGGWETFKKYEANALPVWLEAAGYETAFFGKYMNGYAKYKPPHPRKSKSLASVVSGWFTPSSPDLRLWVPQGWDLWYALTSERYYDYAINENGVLVNFGDKPADYSTDVLKNRAVRFIKDQTGSTKPFFMLIATKAPHVQGGRGGIRPAIASPTYADAFADVKLPRTSAFDEADMSDKPPLLARSNPFSDAQKREIERYYRGELQSLRSVDDLVAGVVDALHTTAKFDNTIIIYTSDNGFIYGDHRMFGKNSVYEPSIKVPLVMEGPGVPHNETRGQLVNNLDVVATIEQVSGVTPGVSADGHSLTPLLLDANSPWRSAILIEGGGMSRFTAVRTATKKYAHYEDGFEELYDLVSDPYELDNKAKDPNYHGDLLTLRALDDKLKSCAGAGCWIP